MKRNRVRRKEWLFTLLFYAFVCVSSAHSAQAQSHKTDISVTKEWIANKISLHMTGFIVNVETPNEPQVKQDASQDRKFFEFSAESCTHTDVNLILKYKVRFVNNRQSSVTMEHVELSTWEVIIPWRIFLNPDNMKIDRNTDNNDPSGKSPNNNLIIKSASNNAISIKKGVRTIATTFYRTRNNELIEKKDYTGPAEEIKSSNFDFPINLEAEPNLEARLLKAFQDLNTYNKSKKEAY